jgi:ADP-ribosylglycohydrolase
MNTKERIRGAFLGLYFGSGTNPRVSIYDGDALRVPSMYTPAESREKFGKMSFEEFESYRDYKLYDQHTQSKMVYEILMKYGEITPEIFKEYLLDLHKTYDVFKGDVYGPSTQRAIRAIETGEDLYQMGRRGITCGSAMRALPIAMYFYNDYDKLIQNTVNACVISHNTDVAIDAAIACNVTLAALISGKSKFVAIEEGIAAAKKYHGQFGEPTTEPKMYERLRVAIDSVQGKTLEEAAEIIGEKVGVSWFARETIPGAFANYAVTNTPEDSCMLAQRCGGDNQTVPEIACAFMGAERGPEVFREDILHKIEAKNDVGIFDMAEIVSKKVVSL